MISAKFADITTSYTYHHRRGCREFEDERIIQEAGVREHTNWNSRNVGDPKKGKTVNVCKPIFDGTEQIIEVQYLTT